jgi:dihydroorotase-like cyclic amidohydrolase
MKTLIQDGTIVTATDTHTVDVLLDGETISQIGAKHVPALEQANHQGP